MTVAPYRYRIFVETSGFTSGKALNVYNVGNDVALSDANVTTILNALSTFYSAGNTYIVGTFACGARVLEYRPGVATPRIVGVAAVNRANSTSSAIPGQMAAVMAWRTALAGKSYRGRTFLGPLSLNALNGQVLLSTFTGLMNPAAATLITAVKAVCTAPWGLIVHSDKIPDDTPIVNGFMDSRVDVIRSRN